MKRYRLEVWNRTNTARLAIARHIAGLERRRVLGGEETVTVALSLDDPALDHLTRGSVLRVQEEGAAAFTLWRYAGRDQERSEADALSVRIRADALWMDFRHGLLRDVQADGRTLTSFGLVGLTPTAWLEDFIIPSYDGDAIAFALGTVERTTPVGLTFAESSPLEALRMLEREAVGEVQFRLNGAGDTYLVDLLERIGTGDGAELRYGKNIREVQKEEDEAEVVTRLYATGADGLTLADARWGLAGVAGNVLSFEGEHPVFEDGAFVGLWFYSGGIAYEITAADADAGTITVVDAAGLSGGDEGWLAVDAQGTRLAYLESPSAVAESGVRVGLLETDIPNVANLLENGDLSAWTGGAPDGWSVEGTPVTAQSTDPVYARHGGSAAHVTADAADEGLLSNAIEISGDGARPYHSILAGVTIVSGRVRLELRHSNGRIYPLEEQAQTTTESAYTVLRSFPVHAEPLPAGTAQLAVVAHGAAAEFYLDTALVTRSIGETEPEFLAGSGARELWAEAARELADAARQKVEYRIRVADLFKADPDRFQFDELGLGDDVRVRDPAIGRESLRIVEVTEDLVNAAATHIAVAADPWTRPNDPWRRQQRRRRRSGGTPVDGAPRAALLSASQEVDVDDGLLYVTVVGNGLTTSVDLYTRAARSDPWPSSPDETIVGREGTFAGFMIGDAVYWRAVPVDAAGVSGEPWEGGEKAVEPADLPQPPTLDLLELDTSTRSQANVRVTGEVGSGGTGPLEYAHRVTDIKNPAPAFSEWAALGSGVTLNIARHLFWPKFLHVKVRDADGRESAVRRLVIASQLLSHDESDGRVTKVKRFAVIDEPTENVFKRGSDSADDVVASGSRTFIIPSYVDASLRVTTLRRSAIDEPSGNLFKRGSDTAADVVATAARTFIEPTYVDGSLRPNALIRSTVKEVAENLFKKSSDTADSVVASGTRTFVKPSLVDASFRITGVYRSAIEEPVANLFKRGSNTADDVVPSGTRDFIAPGYIDGNKRPTKLRRSAADVTADALIAENESITRLGGRTLSNIADDASFRRTAVGFIDASNRITGVYRAAVTESVDNLFKRGVNTTSDVVEVTDREFASSSQKTGGGRAVQNIDGSLHYTGAVFKGTTSEFQGPIESTAAVPVYAQEPSGGGVVYGYMSNRNNSADGLKQWRADDVDARIELTQGGGIHAPNSGWRIQKGPNPYNLQFLAFPTPTLRFYFTTGGQAFADVGWSTFSPRPPKDPALMAAREWLAWALEDAGKAVKPYAGIPDRLHPVCVDRALMEGRSVNAVVDEERARYVKDPTKIAIGVARWAGMFEAALRESLTLSDLKLKLGVD